MQCEVCKKFETIVANELLAHLLVHIFGELRDISNDIAVLAAEKR